MNFDKLKKLFGVSPAKEIEPEKNAVAIAKSDTKNITLQVRYNTKSGIYTFSCAFKDLDSKSFSETKAHWETILKNVSLSTSPFLLFDDMLVIKREDFVSAAIFFS